MGSDVTTVQERSLGITYYEQSPGNVCFWLPAHAITSHQYALLITVAHSWLLVLSAKLRL